MDAKDEKREVLKKKILYFFASMSLYMLIYLFFYIVLAFVNAIFELGPYTMLVCMIVIFPLAVFFTDRILRLAAVRNLLE